jgi:hypothetical protein
MLKCRRNEREIYKIYKKERITKVEIDCGAKCADANCETYISTIHKQQKTETKTTEDGKLFALLDIYYLEPPVGCIY